jgi:hypothetical protein
VFYVETKKAEPLLTVRLFKLNQPYKKETLLFNLHSPRDEALQTDRSGVVIEI